jgi:bacterioferritin-associated ferredoxin
LRGVWVCLCRAVTSGQVIDAIGAGARTVREVRQACGAATDCTKCTLTIRMLLEQETGPVDDDAPGGPT